jgi:hypothetical protein
MNTLPTVIWIAACSNQLHKRWRYADPVRLEETAWDLWRDSDLRELGPVDAAKAWADIHKPGGAGWTVAGY